MRIAARAGRLAGRAVILVGFLVFAFLVIGPLTGRYRTLTVLTASMGPTYPAGSIVVVVPVPIEKVAVGDVITYSIPVEDHRIITHRVIEVVEPGVVRTKGDANNTADPWVARLQGTTAWEARAGVPGAGYLMQLVRGPLPRLIGVFSLTLLALLIGLPAIWRRPGVA